MQHQHTKFLKAPRERAAFSGSRGLFVMRRIEYKPGEKIGECTYLREVEPHVKPSGGKVRKARFKCRCGWEFESGILDVKSGNTTSCGCYQIETVKKTMTKHGLWEEPIYDTWINMKARCYNPTQPGFEYWGGAGVTVCDEWKNHFISFHAYMSKLPFYEEAGYSIDRFPNSSGNYEPGNVRWATAHEQAVNQGMQKNNTSGYKGVCFAERDRVWVSYISVNGRQIKIGTYGTVEEAVIARNNYIIDNNLTGYKIQEVKK